MLDAATLRPGPRSGELGLDRPGACPNATSPVLPGLGSWGSLWKAVSLDLAATAAVLLDERVIGFIAPCGLLPVAAFSVGTDGLVRSLHRSAGALVRHALPTSGCYCVGPAEPGASSAPGYLRRRVVEARSDLGEVERLALLGLGAEA